MAARAVAPLRSHDRVVVIGAGPAGLTAAYLLARDGVDVTVLEADRCVGGISRTVVHQGFRFDIGGHRFFTKIAAVEALWREWLGDEFIAVPRLSRIFYDGRFFDYPIRPINVLARLGPLEAARIVFSYLKWHFRPHPAEDTFEEWVTNRFGQRLYEMFFKSYTEKVWGIPCTEIRAEWAAQRIQGLSLLRAILTAASLNRRSTIKSLIEVFQYPRLGPGQMWDACRTRVEAAGGRVLLGRRMASIAHEGGRVRGVTAESASGRETFAADHVISSAPIGALVEALDPPVPAEARTAAAGLRYRDFVVVALVLRRDEVFRDNWIYVHSPEVRVGRVQNFKNWSAAMVPEPHATCLGAEYFCFAGDELWESSDDDLVALAARELEHLGLISAREVVDGAVVRMPKAYPVYDATYRERLDVIRRVIDPIANLHTVGRNGMHKYNNQDHSMLTAMMTVWNMRGASHDVWQVNTDFDYHEVQRLDAPTPAGVGLGPAASRAEGHV